MSSPSKKRKLNSGSASKPSSHGLEYFFAKQQKPKKEVTDDVISEPLTETPQAASTLTDEEYARQLQAEFDREASLASQPSVSTTPQPPAQSQSASAPTKPETPKQTSTSAKTLALQSTTSADDGLCESLPLDENPIAFDPQKYLPQLAEQWKSQKDGCAYFLLVRCFVLINGTTSRIKIVDTLVNCLRIIIEGDPHSLLPAVRLRPFHDFRALTPS